MLNLIHLEVESDIGLASLGNYSTPLNLTYQEAIAFTDSFT